ncbi:MAG: hypothetical protein CMB68_04345 [Euryarchaeota archaeon]|nr:hypothetical protein [Euryarchaeota archaeon]|tara:strand:+ start:15404 stop:16957 length:1554 start_codon:yes stop_codon:yes gene_type:complete
MDNQDDLDSLADSISDVVLPAPEIQQPQVSLVEESTMDDRIEMLRSREEMLLRIDRMLISSGSRLVLFLPLIVIVLYGLAQAFSDNDPEWWTNHLESVAWGSNISTAIYGLSLLLLVADTAMLILLFWLISTTKSIFSLESSELTRLGLTFKSSHGYAEMRATIDGAIRQLGITTTLISLAAIMLGLVIWLPEDNTVTPFLFALSTGALLSGHGVHMVSERSRFNTSEPWGMLQAFSPPIHPALLNRPFTDVIRAHVDPLLAVRMSEYLSSIEPSIREGSTRRDLQETLLHLLYLRRSSLIDENQFRSAFEPMLDSSTIERLFNHPELGEETWDRLLSRARSECAPFFRIHDRLRMSRLGASTSGDIWLDVDMENLVVGQANLFAFVLNQGNTPLDLVLRVQTPDFRPQECVYRLNAQPMNLGSEVSEELYSKLPSLISSTNIIWQSLLPSAMGEATVTLRLEDEAGNLISGRVLTVQIRSDLLTRVRMSLGGLFMLGAVVVTISPFLPFLFNLIGL